MVKPHRVTLPVTLRAGPSSVAFLTGHELPPGTLVDLMDTKQEKRKSRRVTWARVREPASLCPAALAALAGLLPRDGGRAG